MTCFEVGPFVTLPWPISVAMDRIRATDSLVAARTGAEKVEAGFGNGKAQRFGHLVEGRVERCFSAVVKLEVGDISTAVADQVVVMSSEVFGQLVSREFIGRDDPAHRTNLFEDGQVSIHARLRKRRIDLADLSDGERTAPIDERLDQPASTGGVALICFR